MAAAQTKIATPPVEEYTRVAVLSKSVVAQDEVLFVLEDIVDGRGPILHASVSRENMIGVSWYYGVYCRISVQYE